MRRQDRASAVACVDQPQVLRQMFSAFREGARIAAYIRSGGAGLHWSVDWARMQAGTTAARDRTNRRRTRAELINGSDGCSK